MGGCSAKNSFAWLDHLIRWSLQRKLGVSLSGTQMSNANGYLPGDPRYGFCGGTLKNYYRTRPAQWAIYCWDKPAMADTRRALVPAQQCYLEKFGQRVIGYGHF